MDAADHPFSTDDAILIAARAHAGQRDKGRPDLPYITHPMRVMAYFTEPVLQQIAVLHDSVEDSKGVVTLDSLRRHGAPERVVAGVDAMTHRKGESDEDYWLRLRENPDALRVKDEADIEDNLDPARLALLPPERAERAVAKYTRARRVLRHGRAAL
jgi:(p)ppGpp synthase/HD superfamily hydrolase